MTPFFQLSIKLSLFLLLSLFLKPFDGQAQSASAIHGKLVDAALQPLPFANVVLYKGEELVTGVVSADNGSFSLPIHQIGSYSIRITAIGYTDLMLPVITVGQLPYPKDLGWITVQEAEELLNTVEVLTSKHIILVEDEQRIIANNRMLIFTPCSPLHYNTNHFIK